MAILREIEEEANLASSVSAGTGYDVFLSFRGEDTRHNFTDHLYNALVEADLDTFLDDHEIETGEELKPELERAIKQSRASIIVLSRNYASSSWCLNELVMILQRKETSNHIVFPIFYHVDPSHVRKLQNSYAEAMAKHDQNIKAECHPERKKERMRNMERWKEALVKVADLKGREAQGSERKFIQEIVTEIDRRLNRKQVSSTPPRLIGMQSLVQDITSWLQDGSSNVVDILTICGIGGIGKTHLAKYIYESNFQEFERRSFLEDIGGNSTQPTSILGLQKQLLGDIRMGGLQNRFNVSKGTNMIEKALLTKRVLLVLDDVNEASQLDALLGKKGFHPGSKIIITTKDKLLPHKCDVFNLEVSSKNYTEHLLKGLNIDESLELLSWHAFRSNHPKEGYKEESKKLVQYCGGHPLALKVLGGSLFKRDIAAWEDTLQLLGKEVNPQIQNVLKISFDFLQSRNDKELFKHIACFFVGEKRDYTEIILKGCDVKTSSGIPNLIDRCLLTIDPFNRLMMHQLLQEMGKEMVREESLDEPENRSRLWCHEESFTVLKEEKGSGKIQGLVLNMQMLNQKNLSGHDTTKKRKFEDFVSKRLPKQFEDVATTSRNPNELELKTDAFRRMDKLTLLQLNFVQLAGSYENFPKSLRWLCWHGFPLESIPSNLPMENLVVLDMSYSKLKRLWKMPKWLGSLKILDLRCSDELVRTPDFSGLPNLERLILERCVRLVKVRKSIGELDRLVLLDLRYCKKLRKLPRSIGKLKLLKTLLLDGCSNLGDFPMEKKNMESLEQLDANNIGINLQALPRSQQFSLLAFPRSLVSLSLAKSNLSNESFPIDLSSIPLLESLDISGNPIDSLPNCVRSLNRLQRLDLDRCGQLKSVLCLPSTIKLLSVVECMSLEKVTLHSALSKVPLVRYFKTDQLTEVQGIFKSQPITKVDEEIINSLGWSNLGFVQNLELQMYDAYHWKRTEKLPVQIMYEFGIFSIFFPGKEVPNWFTHKSKGPSISFTVPSSPQNHRIQGLNMCFVDTFSGDSKFSLSTTKISNMTKSLTWMYKGKISAVQEDDEDIVCLSHWRLENQLEDGDEVTVSKGEAHGVNIRECGISLVYNDTIEEKDMHLDLSWKHIIGGDLSAFQLTTGDYLLTHDRFRNPNVIQYKDKRSWYESICD